MAFDPDAYLNQDFDPDKYLSSEPPKKLSGYEQYVADYKKRQAQPQIPRSPTDTQFPKMEPMLSEEEWTKKDNWDFAKSVADRALGVPDAAISFLSKLPAQAAIGPSYLYARLRGKDAKTAEDIAAQIGNGPSWTDPKTQTGEQILQGVGTHLQAFGPDPYTRIGTLRKPIGRIPKLESPKIEPSIPPKPVEPTVPPFEQKVQTPSPENAGQRAFNDIALTQMEGYQEPFNPSSYLAMEDAVRNFRGRDAQNAIDARQAALEFEVAKQQKADFNAAERARQEAAPVPGLPPKTPPEPMGGEPIPVGEVTELPIKDNVSELTPTIPVGEVTELNSLPKPNLQVVPTDFRGQRGSNQMLTDFTNTIGKWAGLTKDSPEVQKGKEAVLLDKKREVLYNSIPTLDPFRPIFTTPEKVLGSLDDPKAKDLGPVAKVTAQTIKPGVRTVRAANNNPLVGFVQYHVSRAFTGADALTRQYLTNPTGAGHLWEKLSKDEQIQVYKLLKQGSDEIRDFTPQEMLDGGYSQKQIDMVQAWYKAKDYLYDYANKQLGEVGKQGFDKRPGWMPGVFEGDFWSLAMDGDKVVGFVGNNTKAGYNAIISKLKEENPNLTFTPMKKKALEGNFRRSDLASGLGDIMSMLAKDDPKIADVQAKIMQITKDRSHAWLGAELHTRDKKGIWGSEGNKPWQKDAHKSAQEAMKAAFRVWEEEALSYTMLPKTAEITALTNNPEVQGKWPRAVDYINDYMYTAVGNHTGRTGAILNNTIDLVTDVVSFGQFGPTAAKGIVNQYTKRMGQLTQGFGNPIYTAMQWLQPFQTAMPEYFRAGDMGDIGQANLVGGKMGAKYLEYKMAESQGRIAKWLRKALGDETVKFTPDEVEIFKYAEDKGLLTFSEYDDVSKTTQGKISRGIDTAIDFNRNQLGERPTRPVVFFTFVDLLRRHADIPANEILDTAYDLTQYSMHDYRPTERPLMYQKLGVVGQLAGNLKQYMHSYIDQTAQWTKQVPNKPQMLIAGLVAMATLQGYKGAPGYDEFDSLVKYLTGKFGDKQVSIGDIVSKNAPDWLKQETPMSYDKDKATWEDYFGYGALSGSTGINFSSRLGSAQVLPNSPIGVVSPYAEKAVRFGQQAADLGRNPKALINMGMELAPSSIKGLLEDTINTDSSGMTYNKQGQKDYQRTEYDRTLKRLGLTSLEESKAKDKVYQSSQAKKANDEIRAKLTGEAIMKFNQLGQEYMKSKDFKDLQEEYVRRGGDPNSLINAIVQGKQESELTTKQRAEGINPNNIPGIRRYQYFNE